MHVRAEDAQTSSTAAEACEKRYEEPKVDNAMRRAFKYYKQRNKTIDLSQVPDLRVSNEKCGLQCTPLAATSQFLQLPGLRPQSDWSLSVFAHRPGLYILNNLLTNERQLGLLERVLFDYAEPPAVTNLVVDGSFAGAGVFANCATRLRWITLGKHYNWTSKMYEREARAPLPPELVEFGAAIVRLLGLGAFEPDAAIINCYPPKANLSAHVDKSERSIDKPLVALSLGQSAIYLSGGESLDDDVDALLLQSGDVLVMHKSQRLVYHAVPRILQTTRFFDAERRFDPRALEFANSCRLNITLRQVDEHK